MSQTAPARSIWRPWPALLIHAGLLSVTIAAAVVPAMLTGTAQLVGLSGLSTSLLQLGLPLSDVLPIPAMPDGQVALVSSVAWMAVVPLYLLALHWTLVAAARRDGRDRTLEQGSFVDPSAPTPSAPSPARSAPAVAALLTLSVGAGAACWAGWLAAPGALGYDAFSTTLALAGAIATALVVAVVMARVVRSIGGPLGVSAGLWLAHMVWLVQQDSALWAFAALLALPVAAAVAALATTFSFATGLTGQRSPTVAPPPPTTGWVFSSELSTNNQSAPTKTG